MRNITLADATRHLRLEIRQLTHELDIARQSEQKRIREEIRIRQDSLRHWIQLQRMMDEIEREES